MRVLLWLLAAFATSAAGHASESAPPARTEVSIVGEKFHLNGSPAHAGALSARPFSGSSRA